MRRPAYDDLQSCRVQWRRYVRDPELREARAARRGLTIEEVPGAYIRRTDKKSTVRGLSDSARYFRQLLRFRKTLEERNP